MKKKFLGSLVLLLAALWPVLGSATLFNEIVVLGDSLSDQGNVSAITGGIIPPSEYSDETISGRFTNGLNYIDYLSSRLNITVSPSELGGTNYAYGGARTDSQSFGGVPTGGLSLLQQRDAYIGSLGGAGANPNALHVVWGGSNDLTDIIETVLLDPTFEPIPAVINAASNIANVVGSLVTVGATDILVPNVPNLGIVPFITQLTGGLSPEATALSGAFNMALDIALNNVLELFPAPNLIEFDVFNLLTEAFSNPAAFGFSNVTEACFSSFVLPGGTICSDPDGYLSWDGFHPTTATHRILADSMAQAVPEPNTLVLMTLGLAGFGFSRRRWRLSIMGNTNTS